jgi:hypothetical protein
MKEAADNPAKPQPITITFFAKSFCRKMIKIFAPVLSATCVQSVSCFLLYLKVRQAFAQSHGIYIHQNIKGKGCGKFQAGDELPAEYPLVLKCFPLHWLLKPVPG